MPQRVESSVQRPYVDHSLHSTNLHLRMAADSRTPESFQPRVSSLDDMDTMGGAKCVVKTVAAIERFAFFTEGAVTHDDFREQ